MMSSRLTLGSILAACFIFTVAVSSTAAEKPAQIITLDNGLQVILKENHGSPMVASVIFVKSGSKYESRFENGLTHFLEHLLFDGTVNETREQLDGSIRNLGGYINAFTRKDLTAYLVLLPRQFIDYGLTVQADMLFCSTIPAEELPKERKVVIEEINRSSDAPGAVAEEFFISHAYAGTDYARPVLGYAPFIDNIPRQAIIAYWKKYYTPDNMIMLVIGDFETEAMKQTVENVFGRFTNASGLDSSAVKKHRELLSGKRSPGTALTGTQVFDTVANVQFTYIDVSCAAPRHDDSDYVPMSLLSEYLALDEVSPLKRALQSGADPLATEVSVSLDARQEFSRLNISVASEHPEQAGAIVDSVTGILSRLVAIPADPEALDGIKTSVKCQNIYYAEKLHYYGFMIAPMMMTTGWEFVRKYPQLLEQSTWPQAQAAAKRWLADPKYIATIVRPADTSTQKPYQPASITAEEVRSYFDTAGFPSYDLSLVPQLRFPATDSIGFQLVDSSVYRREVLANGLTVIIKTSPASEVFAINVLGRNRSASEPADKAGITDFVNRCFDKGTLSRSAAEFSRDLNSIGANLTLTDNPWIPYDDRYTSRQFSFVKFETIDSFARRGFGLFADMLLNPAFDSVEVERVRRALLGVIRRNTASPSKVARSLFYQSLFGDKAYAHPIMGTAETIAAITPGDLRDYQRRFYAPQNIILSIATSRPAEEVMDWVRATFGRLKKSSLTPQPAGKPDVVKKVKEAHTDLDKQQVSIYVGGILPGAKDSDAIPLQVAISILSHRLYLTLREKEGLAYSTGAGARFDPEFGWYYCTIGTASDNYQKAREGILLQIDKLRLDGPTYKEVERARNAIWGRLMSAKLSRLNQAYYMGVDEYLGRSPRYDSEFLGALSKVTPETVRRVAARYLRTDSYVVASAGKRPKE